MVEGRSSFVSKNNGGQTNQWAIYGIGGKREKQPSEATHNLELTIACGGSPVISPPQDANPKNVGHQYNKNDGLDLGLGTLLVHHREPLDTRSLIDAIGRDNSIDCLLRCPRVTYGCIALLNRSFRELIKSGEIYRLRRENNVIEHWVYFCCDLPKWEAFDPSTKTWMKLPMMKADQCFVCTDKESMAVGTKLLVLGRGLSGHATYVYDFLTNSWSLGKVMNAPRVLFGSASLGEVAVFAGGITRTGTIMDAVELYDSRTGNWQILPSLLKPRKLCSGVYMDGKFYVIGGIGKDLRTLKCGEEYDFETKKWTEIPNMSPVNCRGGMAPPLVAAVGNELYAADSDKMELRKYDKKKKEWEVLGRLPERAQAMDGWGMAFRGCGERVIVLGGPRRNICGILEIYSWIPSKGPLEWSLIGQKRSDNFVFNCAVMGC
ncbi:hypothetical protein LXL04_025185 [Taraxacum kok-saghyz]